LNFGRRHFGPPDSERHIRKHFVSAVEEADALVPGGSPVRQEVVDDVGVLEHDVVHVAVRLTEKSSADYFLS
jgi:hypothetical protein